MEPGKVILMTPSAPKEQGKRLRLSSKLWVHLITSNSLLMTDSDLICVVLQEQHASAPDRWSIFVGPE